ncbi:MAG: hypothetical protein ABFD89_18390 [Bryobacteraceae bacterium]
MALYVYRVADGSLFSWAPTDDSPVASAEELAAAGLALASGMPALDASHAWDAATKTVVETTPAPIPKPIGTSRWILRFTPQEFQAITASTDAKVEQFMFALEHTMQLDLSDPVIVDGIAYLVSINLLVADRVAAILASA